MDGAAECALDGVKFTLARPFDLGFLRRWGRVFCVFDQNDSGNLSFGLEGEDGARHFVKLAGARTLRGAVAPGAAVQNLKRAMPVYRALRHPALVGPVWHGPVPGGYAAAYPWVEGECLHAHWTFDAVPKYTHPASPFVRFRQLPLEKKLRALETVLDFHRTVARRGYVAIDFYDGSLIYDFARDEVHICDIDFYTKAPFVNTMGRLWGSARFMSPEEHTAGAVIDQVTNVYTMGATAFALLGGGADRAPAHWAAGPALLAVAQKATRDRREERYESMDAFAEAWQAAWAAGIGCPARGAPAAEAPPKV